MKKIILSSPVFKSFLMPSEILTVKYIKYKPTYTTYITTYAFY